jgi:hypothetical protein
VLALGTVAVIAMGRVRRDRWVHQTALPELQRLVTAAENDSAFELALRIEEAAPWRQHAQGVVAALLDRTVIQSTPAGATVYRASTADTSRWFLVGTDSD